MYSVHIDYQLKMLQHEDPANLDKLQIKFIKCMLIHIHSCSVKMKPDSLLAHPNSRRVVRLVCDTSLKTVMGVFSFLSTKTKNYCSTINTKPEDNRARAKTSANLC